MDEAKGEGFPNVVNGAIDEGPRAVGVSEVLFGTEKCFENPTKKGEGVAEEEAEAKTGEMFGMKMNIYCMYYGWEVGVCVNILIKTQFH